MLKHSLKMLSKELEPITQEKINELLTKVLAQLPPFLQNLAKEVTFEPNELDMSGQMPEAHQKGTVIYLSEKFFDLYKDSVPVHGIIAHELGHYYKEKMKLNLNNIYSRQPPYNHLFGSLGIRGVPDTNEEEFAEAFASYFLDPAWLQQYYPEAYSALEDILANA